MDRLTPSQVGDGVVEQVSGMRFWYLVTMPGGQVQGLTDSPKKTNGQGMTNAISWISAGELVNFKENHAQAMKNLASPI